MNQEFVDFVEKSINAIGNTSHKVSMDAYEFNRRINVLASDAAKRYAEWPVEPMNEFDVGSIVSVLRQSGQFSEQLLELVRDRLRIAAPNSKLSPESLETLERLYSERDILDAARLRIYKEAGLLIKVFQGEFSAVELLKEQTNDR